ncbi:cobalamin B12-binding domain-containing protein [Jeotgalibaca sp. A122]|uniref:cobalamin B12-binding domain-containing protein n=1 Tax=Jeotgalibaca sp. A122 TaxID=3457322 RepID=UPI003FD679B1
MEKLYKEVLTALQAENKEQAVMISINALQAGEVTIPELYEVILAPALVSVIDEYPKDEELIWREHVRSGIIRTIIESAYPFILDQRKKVRRRKGNVVVMCPEFEDHELGAKMVADFFKLEGYEPTFIGARTPEKTIFKAIEIVKPDYITISVTNYYNLVSVKKMIENIKAQFGNDFIFIVGGNAFKSNPEAYKMVGADMLINSYDDIKNLDKAVD